MLAMFSQKICLLLFALSLVSSRKSDYKRIVFTDFLNKTLEGDFVDALQNEKLEVVELYKQLLDEYENQHLVRIQPASKVGLKTTVHIEGNRKTSIELQTLSKRRPLIFQIDDFLFPDECDYIKKLVKDKGMRKSETFGEVEVKRALAPTSFDVIGERLFIDVDKNNDSLIDIDELHLEFRVSHDTKMGTLTIHEIMKETLMDFNLDGKVEPWEWELKNLTRLVMMIQQARRVNPASAARFSKTQWLSQTESKDDVLQSIQDRLHKVSGLPLQLIRNSEPLQVVRYKPGGHYDCHLDSDPGYHEGGFRRCCHLMKRDDNSTAEECSVCRFMTVLYFLEDTASGGQTAFPVVGVNPYENQLADETGGSSEEWCDLSVHCSQANVRVEPKKGRAVLWYNHFIHPDTMWLGAVDKNSLHGGCAVHEGTKWIANNWINVGHVKKHDILSWARKDLDPEYHKVNEDDKDAGGNDI